MVKNIIFFHLKVFLICSPNIDAWHHFMGVAGCYELYYVGPAFFHRLLKECNVLLPDTFTKCSRNVINL